jgi:hypothetical protein
MKNTTSRAQTIESSPVLTLGKLRQTKNSTKFNRKGQRARLPLFQATTGDAPTNLRENEPLTLERQHNSNKIGENGSENFYVDETTGDENQGLKRDC